LGCLKLNISEQNNERIAFRMFIDKNCLTSNFSEKTARSSYEITDHLGNVHAVISDRKLWPQDTTTDGFQAEVLSRTDYYPFGMQIENRTFGDSAVSRGFQGMEKDNEISGSGNAYNTEFRGYDPRLGRWRSVDPKASVMPWQSPYVGMDNNPILLNDPKGDCPTCPLFEEKGLIERFGNAAIKFNFDENKAVSLTSHSTSFRGDFGEIVGIYKPTLLTGATVTEIKTTTTAIFNKDKTQITLTTTKQITEVTINEFGKITGIDNTSKTITQNFDVIETKNGKFSTNINPFNETPEEPKEIEVSSFSKNLQNETNSAKNKVLESQNEAIKRFMRSGVEDGLRDLKDNIESIRTESESIERNSKP